MQLLLIEGILLIEYRILFRILYEIKILERNHEKEIVLRHYGVALHLLSNSENKKKNREFKSYNQN